MWLVGTAFWLSKWGIMKPITFLISKDPRLVLLLMLFLFTDMDGSSGPSLYPLHRCKTIHLVSTNIYLFCQVTTFGSSSIGKISFFLGFYSSEVISAVVLWMLQVRHAQGIHNVEGEKNYKVYTSPEYFDANLTPLGWEQVFFSNLSLVSNKIFSKTFVMASGNLENFSKFIISQWK